MKLKTLQDIEILQKALDNFVHTGTYAKLLGIHKQTVIHRINKGAIKDEYVIVDGVYLIKIPKKV